MAISAKTVLAQPARPNAPAVPGGNDGPDPIEEEFLGLWLGISRLRERVLGERALRQAHARKRARRLPSANR